MLQPKERIIEASVSLFIRKGYKGTTTKTIAQEAGVNELTVFRHFGTKEGILRAIIEDRYDYLTRSIEAVKHELEYDINKDFPRLSKLYNEKLAESFGLVVLFLNDDELDEETITAFRRIPDHGKRFLTSYFVEINRRRQNDHIDPEIAALMYMSMNFGYLVMKQKLLSDFSGAFTSRYADISTETFQKLFE